MLTVIIPNLQLRVDEQPRTSAPLKGMDLTQPGVVVNTDEYSISTPVKVRHCTEAS